MSEVLESFPVGKLKVREQYPWKDWMDGRIYKVARGIDYHIKTISFRCAISYQARRNKLRARTMLVIEDKDGEKVESLIFQFFKGASHEPSSTG